MSASKKKLTLTNSWNNGKKNVNFTTIKRPSRRELFQFSFQLLSPLLSLHQLLDTINLGFFWTVDEGKYSLKEKVKTDCGPVMPLQSRICFKIKWCFDYAKLWRPTTIKRSLARNLRGGGGGQGWCLMEVQLVSIVHVLAHTHTVKFS